MLPPPHEVYLVGGAVRDLLLARPAIVDFDFAVPADGLDTARRVANGLGAAYYPLDAERGTGRVVYSEATAEGLKKSHLDFATFRGANLEADLRDRDFTINAIALRLRDPPELIDPLHGQQDLAAGLIRAASDPAFQNDPVRVLRAVRQAGDFSFQLEPHTEMLLGQAVSGLTRVSPERQRDELVRLLNSTAPGQAVQQLQRLAVLPFLLPEVEAMVGVEQSAPHYLDVFDHTTTALTAWADCVATHFALLPATWRSQVQEYLAEPLAGDLNRQSLMPLALLLHDTGKPLRQSRRVDESGYTKIHFFNHEQESARLTRAVLARFRFSRQATSFVETIVAQHMRPLALASGPSLSRRAIYRFFRDSGGPVDSAGVAVALHALIDHQATYPQPSVEPAGQALAGVIDQLLTTFFEPAGQTVDPSPLLSGRDLITIFNLREGPLIGRLLDRLKEAQAVGQVTDKSEALAFLEADPDLITYLRGSHQ